MTAELLDLADLRSVAAFGARLRERHDRLEVLVNNAGVVMTLERQTTADGFELHFGTNHLGHFALASALLPLLRAADAPRVVVVGSLAHRRADIDFDDLQAERSYRRMRAYAQSKLANLLFMTELQRRSDAGGWGVISTGAHPGFARTEAILRPDDSLAKRGFSKVMSPLVPTAESAARPHRLRRHLDRRDTSGLLRTIRDPERSAAEWVPPSWRLEPRTRHSQGGCGTSPRR